jgi:hypothetical protein
MGSDETATACYEYFHIGCFIAGCFYVYCVRGQYFLWYSRIEMNATFDVGCKSEETAVNCVKGLFVYGANISLCKIPSLALGVKAFIIVIYEASDGVFFVTVSS